MRSRAIAVAATLGVTLSIPAPAFAAGVVEVVVRCAVAEGHQVGGAPGEVVAGVSFGTL